MSAKQLIDSLSDIKGNPEAEEQFLQTVLDEYGSEEKFFEAAAQELEVSVDDVKETVKSILSEPVAQDIEANTEGQDMPILNKPRQSPTAPPKMLNPTAMNAATQMFEQQGVAPSQAVNKAANSGMADVNMASGGAVQKKKKEKVVPPPTGDMFEGLDAKQLLMAFKKLPDEAINPGLSSKSREEYLKTLEMAVADSKAGKALTEKEKQTKAAPSGFEKLLKGLLGMQSKGYDQEDRSALDAKIMSKLPAEDRDISNLGYNEGQEQKSKGLMRRPGYAEGGLVDDLPATSTEEQADDIKANLSHNEFVWPAYAVKYFGLQKLMFMLECAKEEMEMLEQSGEVKVATKPKKGLIEADDEFSEEVTGSVEEESFESADAEEEDEEEETDYKKGGLVPKKKRGRKKTSLDQAAPKVKVDDNITIPRGPNETPYGMGKFMVKPKRS